MLGTLNTAFKLIKLYKNWPLFFLCRLKAIKDKEIVLRFRNGLKWHIMSGGGTGIISDVWLSNPYEFLLKDNPKTFIDLGAHIGSFSILAATKFPESKVFSFEASPVNFRLIRRNINENGITNVSAFNYGAAKETSILTFYLNKNSTGLNSFIPTENYKNKVVIKCKSLDDIFSMLKISRCDSMKIDIEGFEADVLEGASTGTLSKINRIAIEVEPKTELRVKNILKKNGFMINKEGNILYAKK